MLEHKSENIPQNQLNYKESQQIPNTLECNLHQGLTHICVSPPEVTQQYEVSEVWWWIDPFRPRCPWEPLETLCRSQEATVWSEVSNSRRWCHADSKTSQIKLISFSVKYFIGIVCVYIQYCQSIIHRTSRHLSRHTEEKYCDMCTVILLIKAVVGFWRCAAEKWILLQIDELSAPSDICIWSVSEELFCQC